MTVGCPIPPMLQWLRVCFRSIGIRCCLDIPFRFHRLSWHLSQKPGETHNRQWVETVGDSEKCLPGLAYPSKHIKRWNLPWCLPGWKSSLDDGWSIDLKRTCWSLGIMIPFLLLKTHLKASTLSRVLPLIIISQWAIKASFANLPIRESVESTPKTSPWLCFGQLCAFSVCPFWQAQSILLSHVQSPYVQAQFSCHVHA